jgi:hypothetical protein
MIASNWKNTFPFLTNSKNEEFFREASVCELCGGYSQGGKGAGKLVVSSHSCPVSTTPSHPWIVYQGFFLSIFPNGVQRVRDSKPLFPTG